MIYLRDRSPRFDSISSNNHRNNCSSHRTRGQFAILKCHTIPLHLFLSKRFTLMLIIMVVHQFLAWFNSESSSKSTASIFSRRTSRCKVRTSKTRLQILSTSSTMLIKLTLLRFKKRGRVHTNWLQSRTITHQIGSNRWWKLPILIGVESRRDQMATSLASNP